MTDERSETPRTDAAITDWAATDEACVYADFARQLERELAAAKAEVELLIDERDAAESALLIADTHNQEVIEVDRAMTRALAIAEENERCAKVCDEGVKWTPNFPPNIQRVSTETAALLAKAIRAPKEKPC